MNPQTPNSEIERKFLVRGYFLQLAITSHHIQQAYLSSNPQCVVRIRIQDDQAFLTIKGPTNDTGVSRLEWEIEIPANDAQQLLQIAEPGSINKTRYLVPNTDGQHTWEVDVFHGDNEGLLLAEIELNSEDDPFDIPDWIGEEVTGQPQYYNSSLINHPYKSWK